MADLEWQFVTNITPEEAAKHVEDRSSNADYHEKLVIQNWCLCNRLYTRFNGRRINSTSCIFVRCRSGDFKTIRWFVNARFSLPTQANKHQASINGFALRNYLNQWKLISSKKLHAYDNVFMINYPFLATIYLDISREHIYGKVRKEHDCPKEVKICCPQGLLKSNAWCNSKS